MPTTHKALLAPILAGFFIIGFCDMVAPVSGYIASEFDEAQQALVSFLPSMVFLWFLLLSTPVASLMCRIGRRATAQIGYLFTIVGLLIPYLAGEGCPLGCFFVGFGLLGVGNTVLQVAVNPMLADIAPANKMTTYLTLGQVFRNLSLLLVAPILTLLMARVGSWRLLLLIYALATVVGALWMQLSSGREINALSGQAVSTLDCFRLLRQPMVLVGVSGIAAFIMADVANGYLSSYLLAEKSSILTSTAYYGCRIVGTLVGVWVLHHLSDLKYLLLNLLLSLGLLAALLAARSTLMTYLLFGMMGFSFSCVFATFYTVATQAAGSRSNEAAGLLVMAISAGALSGPIVGAILSHTSDTRYGLLFVALCVGWMVIATLTAMRHETKKNPTIKR